MPERHADDLFSAAYDGGLGDAQRSWFDEHLRDCAQCRGGFDHFQASVDALRALPAARMPRPVHLPSTPPVAELNRLGRIALPRGLRLRPGMATGLSAVAAAVIVIVALTHQSPPATNDTSSLRAGGAEQAAPQAQPQCPVAATAASAAAPTGFTHRNIATDAGRPGQQLILATESAQVAAGARVPVYAILTAPLPAAGVPAGSARAADVAAVPCLSVASSHGATAVVGTASAGQPAAGSAVAPAPGAASQYSTPPLYYVTVPPGTPPGTVLQLVASVPGGYPRAGDPPFSVEVTVTVR